MKNPTAVTALIILNLFYITSWAQVKLMPNQVKEIVIHSKIGGLNGGMTADIKVVAEVGKWNSYLTRKTSSLRLRQQHSYDSLLNRFITVISPATINNLLNGITVIKSIITQSTFGLTPNVLIAGLKADAKLPLTRAPDFEDLITQKIINEAIKKSVVEINRMDDYEYCDILIITRHNDTVKLSTQNVCCTKLPWTLNNHPTYDMAINSFVVAAIDKEDVPNKEALNISSLKESIFNYIDEHNANAPIATFRWNYNYPENVKLLTEHFTIKERFYYGDVYTCVLKTSTMPANAIFECRVDMTRREDINQIIEYAAHIDKYFKTDNFVYKYYNNRPQCLFDFSYYTGQSPYSSLSYLNRKLPELAKVDSTKTLNLLVIAPDESSYWTIFPDNKMLLTRHSVTTQDGKTAPIYPVENPNITWTGRLYSYYLFDSTGKVLAKGDRL